MDKKQITQLITWPLRFIGLNLYLWPRFLLGLLPHPEVRKDDRFMTMEDIETVGLVHYQAPFTGTFTCVIPKNTVLTALQDSARISTGFDCVPEGREQFELAHVPEEIRNDPKYAGYSFILRYSEIGKKYRTL